MAAPHVDDPIRNEWFVGCEATLLTPATTQSITLLDTRVLLTRGADGSVSAFADQCPHRGAALSLGTYDGETIACPYHGWQFSNDGKLAHQPAHPDLAPPAFICLHSFRAQERYGFVWVCLGDAPQAITDYEPYDRRPDRNVIYGPKVMEACGPRIVENFLDMAHFPFVHADILGQAPHTAVRPYDVVSTPQRIDANDCVFWQPNPGPHATQGGDVAYHYMVDTPFAAMLDKLPADADGGAEGSFSLLIVASPETEMRCRVWMITSAYGDDTPLQTFADFNALIFEQDIVTVESQRPYRLPLRPTAERHQAADRLSLAYRSWLRERGVRYGTSANDVASEALS